MEAIDHIYPFSVGEKGRQILRTRTDRRGVLELQAVEGGTVYLFRGSLSVADCEAAIKAGNANFHLAAAIGQSATVKMEDSLGDVTVFSPKATVGFVKITTC